MANASPIKNVIVMIADGAGFNTLEATRLYLSGLANGDARAGAAGKTLVADGAAFTATAQSVYALDTRTVPLPEPTGDQQNPAVVYDPAKNYDFARVAGTDPNGQPRAFAGYEWNRATYPDSGNTASAIATGEKTYNNAIDVDGSGDELFSIVQEAKQFGKSTGVVSSVQFSDATPAALGGAHDIARSNANSIALEMFGTGMLDVIGGTGNPDFNDNGGAAATPNYTWIGADLWNSLKADTYRSQDGQSWQLLQDRASIQAAGTGTPTTERLAMIQQAFTSNNFNRDGAAAPNTAEVPFSVARLATSPTLSELSLAALNKLDADPDGMYLMIEGGAVDRAMHANNLGRMVEEYIDFNNAVKSVIDYINSAASRATMEDTLVVVTADHDHLLFGPEGATIPYQAVQPDRNGDGLPEGLFFSTNHSNQVIPLYTWGATSSQVLSLADQRDSFTDASGQTIGSNRLFTDQAELGDYIQAQVRLGATAVTTGNDAIAGSEAGETLVGDAGNDLIEGAGGNDAIDGGAGNDTISGGTGNDTITGGAGADVVFFNVATDGQDSTNGGDGADLVNVFGASAGQVRLSFVSGQVGNGSATDAASPAPQDGGLAVRLQAEGASDTLTGLVSRFDDEGMTFVSGTAGLTFDVRDVVSGVQRGDLFEVVALGTAAADTITTATAAATRAHYINAGAGNDTVTGGSAADFLVGGAGDDRLSGAGGDDRFIGGAGNDVIDGGAGTDTAVFNGTFGAVRYARGAAGATVFTGPEGQDTLANHEGLQFTDSAIQFNPGLYATTDVGLSSRGGQVLALYDGILGRAPDAPGLGYFADLLEGGASLSGIAQTFLTSAEYTARNGNVGQESNAGFVNEIYGIALNRSADAGAQYWVNALATGTSRADVAVGIATSAENVAGLQTQLSAGVVTPNAEASVVARLYLGLLDRAPDAAGLASFTQGLESGLTVRGAALSLLTSQEYGAKVGTIGNADFVSSLYDHALGRDGGSDASFWVDALNSGTSRADVAVGIIQSPEATTYLSIPIEQGWVAV